MRSEADIRMRQLKTESGLSYIAMRLLSRRQSGGFEGLNLCKFYAAPPRVSFRLAATLMRSRIKTVTTEQSPSICIFML